MALLNNDDDLFAVSKLTEAVNESLRVSEEEAVSVTSCVHGVEAPGRSPRPNRRRNRWPGVATPVVQNVVDGLTSSVTQLLVRIFFFSLLLYASYRHAAFFRPDDVFPGTNWYRKHHFLLVVGSHSHSKKMLLLGLPGDRENVTTKLGVSLTIVTHYRKLDPCVTREKEV